MSNEIKSIHAFDLNIICDYFSTLERQGPGSQEVTLKALGFTDTLSASARIADIGCGTGGQTMVLARHTEGNILGIDLYPEFIDQFNANARNLNLQDRVNGITGTMEELPFADEELDLIWSEGAIYNIGFERGLREWRRFLKPGGHIAVSEASWFTNERPAEIEAFWHDAYPQIDTISAKINLMQLSGYLPLASFVLPEVCWMDKYYAPQALIQDAFLEKHRGNVTAAELVANQRHEFQLYKKYKAFYGYVFYIGRKC